MLKNWGKKENQQCSKRVNTFSSALTRKTTWNLKTSEHDKADKVHRLREKDKVSLNTERRKIHSSPSSREKCSVLNKKGKWDQSFPFGTWWIERYNTAISPLVVKRRSRKQMCLHFLSYDSAAGKQNLKSVFCLMMSPRSRSLELLPQQGQEALSLGFQYGGANAVSWR